MKQFDKIKEFIGKLPGKTKKGLLAGVVVLVLFAVFAAFMLNRKGEDGSYATLFSGLNEQEASEVMAKLQENSVQYRYLPDGTVSVPTEVVDQTRATMAVAGFPKNGFAYGTYLDNSNLMSTETDKQTVRVYEMQDRLQATIRLLDGVKDAIVQLSMGETQKYVLDNKQSAVPTASVMVIMKDGSSPAADQVAGIQRLVAKSVVNMDMGDVAIIDGNGIDVSVKKNDLSSPVSDEKMAFEEKTQLQVESNILKILEPMFGRNNVRVSVKCTAEVQKMVSEESAFTAPNTQDNTGYISRQTLTNEGDGGAGAGGVPGAGTNANVPQYNTQAGQQQGYSSGSSDTDYVLNERKVQSQNEGATIADLTVAVSINTATIDTDRNQLVELIAKAAGIDRTVQGEKIVVVNSAWPTMKITDDGNQGGNSGNGGDKEVVVPPTPGLSTRMKLIIGIAAGVSLLILLVVILLLVRRGKKKRAAALEQLMLEQEMQSPESVLAELERIPVAPLTAADERDKEVKDNIRGFARENPEISAQLLKNWLRGGEEHA